MGSQMIQIGGKSGNNYQSVTMNGNKIVIKNGEISVNGVNIKTGKGAWSDRKLAVFGAGCFFLGCMFMLWLQGVL